MLLYFIRVATRDTLLLIINSQFSSEVLQLYDALTPGLLENKGEGK